MSRDDEKAYLPSPEEISRQLVAFRKEKMLRGEPVIPEYQRCSLREIATPIQEAQATYTYVLEE